MSIRKKEHVSKYIKAEKTPSQAAKKSKLITDLQLNIGNLIANCFAS